ncbi:MAG TPA: VWA domain-containing protein, partial [Candidatus Limnocylindrales bacterium]|nr:VWA domain-containing protein [Candidatus Limnocylindrales bacterium]
MTFAEPALLIGLLAIPLAIAAYVIVRRRRARYVVRFTNVDLLANLVPRRPAWRRHVPPALYVLAMGALLIALARPSATVAVPREDATIVLAMDVSGSMLATDVAPSRLDSAKQAASAFVDQLPATFRIGLVTFGTAAQVAVAPTTDRAEIHAALDSLQ